MCAPGIKVSLDKPEDGPRFKNQRGDSGVAQEGPQLAPGSTNPQKMTKAPTNPLAIPLKVPGIG